MTVTFFGWEGNCRPAVSNGSLPPGMTLKSCYYLPLSLCIFLKWSLFSLLAVLDPRLLSPYSDHLLPYLSKLQTVLFNMQHHAIRINSITLSVSLIHILLFHLLYALHKSDPHCHHHLCHHQSLLLFFTLDLIHISSSSLFHRRLHH